ncbi:hypothetical protein DRJ25_06030 [Candidatus Woesearchaeota archaeon]|nr:MAG: hypothetical protein DRJ25_06030 [Candidatus Woesearchaeota archaeon]
MKKEVFGWAMYDLANTAFSSLFITFFFPLFIKVFLGGNELQIGLAFGISMFFVALLVPFIGAFSDSIRRRMPFVLFSTLLCIIATFLVPFSNLLFALILGGLANFAYHAALTTYNALMISISKKADYGSLSGLGVAFGYAGNFLSIGLAALILSWLGWNSLKGIRSMFFLTAIFFLAFSMITFVLVKDKRAPFGRRRHRGAFFELKKTLKNLRKNKSLLFYLLAVFFIMNAVSAAIVFLYLFGRSRIGLTIPEYMLVFCLFSVTAIFGALYFGRLSDRLGSKKALTIAVILWGIVILVLIFVSNFISFMFAGLIGGVAWGAVIACVRPLLLDIAPKNKIGEYFGFAEMANKFSGIIGPIAFGALVVVWNYTAALVLLLLFFIVGGVFLQKCRGH